MMRTAKPLAAAVAATLTFWCAGAPLADDTEIFTSTPTAAAAGRPNILLIIDTSGSMVDNSVTQAMDYDPVTTYSGTCTRDDIYWRQGQTPTCSSNKVARTYMSCKTALDKLDVLGTAVSPNTAQWRAGTKEWLDLQNGNNNPIECNDDFLGAMNHGLADNDNKRPARGSKGPYTTVAADSISLVGQKQWDFATGNYLNYLANAGADNQVTLTRLEVVKSVARRFLDSLSNVNVGLMRFQNRNATSGHGDGQDPGAADGGYVIHEFAPIETARQTLKDQITALNGNSFTPLSETLYEAFVYWKGEQPEFGDVTTATRYSYSVNAARASAGGRYNTPLDNTCGSNFNVFLTDGDPTLDRSADDEIEGLPGFVGTTGVSGSCSENGGNGSGVAGQQDGDGDCLDDIAKYMYERDLYDDPALAVALDPKNNVRTYMIGFGTGIADASIMGSTAIAGGGKAYVATDSITLNEAFQDIQREVVDANVSFSAPTVAVNAFNRTQNLNDLFMTVFAPSDQYHWAGNLKKYRLLANGTIMDSSAPAKPAVNTTTGFFAKDTRSFWSTVDDGPDVPLGGAANKLKDPATRSVFTDVLGAGTSLTAAGNEIIATNTTYITRTLLGLTGTGATPDDERRDQINWIRGADVDDGDKDNVFNEQRFEMGDPLHARPVSIVYRGTATAPIGVVYAATNDGYLHAIDPATGIEKWAYVPSELLARMLPLRENDVSAVKRYSLDGNLRAFKLDRNGNGIVDITGVAATEDKVLLFFGMGRGGSTYYALDVTNEDSPKLLWKHGGITGDNAFVGLGQSWSTPVVTRVNVSGATQNSDKLVLVFAGGYDITQDNVGYNTDDVGNRLFIVDAISGAVLWHAGPTNTSGLGYDSTANFVHPKLANSIPADVRVIDISGDGFADRMYTADTGGRIWRFDIHNGNPAGDEATAAPWGSDGTNVLVTGGPLASLGFADGIGTSPAAARKFYVAPDASLVTTTSNHTFVNLAIGSGMRGAPKNTQVTDKIYSIRDHMPFVTMTQAQYGSFTVINENTSSLVDATSTLSPTIPDTGAGWKITLDAGEKILSEARTFQGAILFSSYDPDAGTATPVGACTATQGRNGLWIVKALNADPFANRDSNASITTADRRGDLAQQGLAPEAVIIFPSPDDPQNCVGAACTPPPVCLVGLENCGVSFADAPVKTFWSQRDVD
jgi:type IV pilus assembly protein PilY1